MLQPLLVRRVRGRAIELISGERRLKAAINALAGPEDAVHASARSRRSTEMAELAIVENLQRKDLNPMEKAKSFQRYLTEHNCRRKSWPSG